jgi:hypothetical protein
LCKGRCGGAIIGRKKRRYGTTIASTDQFRKECEGRYEELWAGKKKKKREKEKRKRYSATISYRQYVGARSPIRSDYGCSQFRVEREGGCEGDGLLLRGVTDGTGEGGDGVAAQYARVVVVGSRRCVDAYIG